MARGSNRKNAGSQQVPEEIKEYYHAKKRDRMWVVWLLTGATFIVTVLVVLGLFWGGRWAFNKIRDNNGNGNTTIETENGNGNSEEQPAQQSDDGSTEQPEQDAPATNEGASSQSPTTAPQDQASNTPAQTQQPATGTSDELPRTGPTSDE